MTVGGLRRSDEPHSPQTSGPAVARHGSDLGMTAGEAAASPVVVVLERLGSTPEGLTSAEAARRLTQVGPNAVRTHHAQPWRILGRQLCSAVLILLGVSAVVSFFLG